MKMDEPLLRANQRIDGFVVLRATALPNLRSIAYELTHESTGARVLHLHNQDAENLFSVTFPTPPPDDTGVPHILEHSVLAGSEKYHVKDPFFEMVKSSMATFINAMTGSDYTVYPVSSNVRQDFYNLSEVYWDAVFHPLLTENTFQREGHHLEFAKKGDLDSDLIVKGIVFNEMKGSRSNPVMEVYDLMEKNLWPDTPYGKDSGGDPDRIPDLTYKGLRDFHKTFYHPSNAYIFLYGDIPTREHLSFLRDRLARFQREPHSVNIPYQPRWREPRTKHGVYPVGPTDPISAKTFVVVSWIVGRQDDIEEMFAMAILEAILLRNQAAPLRMALIDSKLGEDLTFGGYFSSRVDTSFSVGLKGTEPDRADAIVDLVHKTLSRIADEGIPRERFDAAMQQLAYHYLEITSHYPLDLQDLATTVWIHGIDPLVVLQADKQLQHLRRRYEENPKFLSDLIRKKFLENQHRLTVIVQPDRDAQAKKDAAFAQKMRDIKAALTTDELAAIARNQEQLDATLDAPNSTEAIEALPQLRVADLPGKPREISTAVDKLPGGATLLKNDVFANGVNYLQLSFDLSGLPADLYPYLPLYADCVHKMGAAGQSYISMAQRIASHTGGIGFSAGLNSRVDDASSLLRQGTFTTKFLDTNADKALDVLRDFVFELDPKDIPRLKDVLLQARSQQRQRPASDGLAISLRHAGRGFNLESYLGEMISGVPQIDLFERLANEDVDPLIERIDAIRRFLLNRARVTVSFTGTDSVYETVRRRINAWTDRMSADRIIDALPPFAPWTNSLPREGLAAPMNAAYCAMVMPAPHVTHPNQPSLAVATRLLGLGYVLEEVRFKGTAYGGGCSYNALAQTMSFHSYRDPWVNRTLDVYRNAAGYVSSADWSQRDVDRAIIGTAKEHERPIRPAAATGTALWRFLMHDSPERRAARHAGLLRTTVKDVKRVLSEQFEKHSGRAAVCVVSSREKLEAANLERPETPLAISDILHEKT